MIQYKRWVSMAVVATTVTVMTLGVNTQAAEHHTEHGNRILCSITSGFRKNR